MDNDLFSDEISSYKEAEQIIIKNGGSIKNNKYIDISLMSNWGEEVQKAIDYLTLECNCEILADGNI